MVAVARTAGGQKESPCRAERQGLRLRSKLGALDESFILEAVPVIQGGAENVAAVEVAVATARPDS